MPPLGSQYEAMAARYFDARCLSIGPGVKTGMPIRIDNPYEVGADRLVNAVAAYERFGGACVVVDFGTGINFDAVSADGEYLGGAIAPGVEISLTALTERGARIGRIELDEPETAIGKSTRGAIQSGVIFGFAGLIDGIARRIERELGGEPSADRDRRPRARDRPLLRDDRRGGRPADAHRVAADLGAEPMRVEPMTRPPLTSPFRIADLEVPNRVLLAPLAGIGNWFVRLQAHRHGAGLAVSEMVSSFAIAHRNRRTVDEMLRLHPDEGPVSIQLFGSDPEVMREAAATAAAAGPALIDLNMGCPVPKVLKTGAGAALLARSGARRRRRAGGDRGLGAAGDRQGALRDRARRSLRGRARRAPGRRGGGRGGRPAPAAGKAVPPRPPRLRAGPRARRRRSTAPALACP